MAEEQYTHPLYCYAMLLDAQYVQQGAWEGGPVETVGFFDGRLFLRFPNEAAANAVTASEEQDFRLATAEEITAAGLDGLAAYPLPTPGSTPAE
jgi:hypothetical protein